MPNTFNNPISVNSVAALAAMNPDGLNSGTVARVEGAQERWYRLTFSAAINADGITVVAGPANTVARWVLMSTSDLLGVTTANQQATWHLDPTNGSDANDGLTAGTAIMRGLELFARWTNGNSAPSATIFLYLHGDIPASDALVIRRLLADPRSITNNGSSLVIIGAETQIGTGTLSAVQNIDKTLSHMQYVEASTLANTWTALGYVGTKIVLTSGPNAGAFAWIVEDLGTANHRAKCTPFFLQSGASADPALATWTQVAVAGTETFKVVTQSAIPRTLLVDVAAPAVVSFQNVRFSSASGLWEWSEFKSGTFRFYGCTTSNAAETDQATLRAFNSTVVSFFYSRVSLFTPTPLNAGTGNGSFGGAYINYYDCWIGNYLTASTDAGGVNIGGSYGTVLDKRNTISTSSSWTTSIGPLCVAGNTNNPIVTIASNATVHVSDYVFGDAANIIGGGVPFNMHQAYGRLLYDNVAFLPAIPGNANLVDFGGATGAKTSAQVTAGIIANATAAESQAAAVATSR